MSRYLLMNSIALLVAIGIALSLQPASLGRCLKISFLSLLLGFPWLYFGINQRAWGHGSNQLSFFGVPLQELALVVLMAFIASGLYSLNYRAILEQASRGSKAEDCPPEKKQDRPR